MEKSNKTVVMLLKINFKRGTEHNNTFFKQHRWEDCQKFRYFKLKVHINLFEEKLYDKDNALFIEQLKVVNLPYIAGYFNITLDEILNLQIIGYHDIEYFTSQRDFEYKQIELYSSDNFN